MKLKLWICAVAAVAFATLGITNVQSQTTVSANNGAWSDPLNWTAGVPGAATWAAINGGHTLDLTPGAVVGLFDVGGGAGQAGNLTIAAGNDLTAVASRIGQSGGAVGNVTMTGGSVSINGVVDGPFLQGDILIGDAGNGTWTITDGTLTAQDEFLVGFINASEGTLDVEGGTVNVGRSLILGVLGNGKGTLNVSGGVVNVSRDLVSSLNVGTSSTLTQSGGTINVGQHFIHGLRTPSTYTQTGGAVNVNGTNSRLTVAESNTSASWDLVDGSITSADIFLGDFDNSHGTMTVSGGSITLRGNLSIGGALASNADSFPPGHALNADGTLIVSGPGGTIEVAGDLLANPADNPRGENDSLLVFEATSGGVSTINVGGIADLTGAKIDFNLLNAFPMGTSFDLISATSISADFMQVMEDIGLINLAIVAGGNGQILRATLVPEPSSVLMLVVGAAGFWGSRRQRGC